MSKYISLTIKGYGFSDIKEKRNYRFDLPCPLNWFTCHEKMVNLYLKLSMNFMSNIYLTRAKTLSMENSLG